MYIYDLQLIIYKVCLVILLIDCLYIIKEKIVKVMRKSKTDWNIVCLYRVFKIIYTLF